MKKILLLTMLALSSVSFAQSKSIKTAAQDFGSQIFVDYDSQELVESQDVQVYGINTAEDGSTNLEISYTDAEDHFYAHLNIQKNVNGKFVVSKCLVPEYLHLTQRHDPKGLCQKNNK